MNMQKIKQMAQELHDAFPGLGITLTTTANGEKGINFYGCSTYEVGIGLLRKLGVSKWEKRAFISGYSGPWCTVTATVDGAELVCFCGGLPPSCRLEEYIEKVPRVETTVTDDFIEIRRQKVVCGEH